MSTSTKKVTSTRKSAEAKMPTLNEGQVYVHNKSRGTFHVPLINADPAVREEPIVFELNEVLRMDSALLKQHRFVKCFDGDFLEIFDEEQYSKFLKEAAARKSSETRKQATGNHESGLPNNRTMAIQQIGMIDDADILEALLQVETRASILAAIEERLEEIALNGDIV